MCGNHPPCRTPILDDHQAPDGGSTPPPLGGHQLRNDTNLAVQCGEQLLDIEEHRLDLDDEQMCASRRARQ